MPLLKQDNGRDGGRSAIRRSLTEFLGIELPPLAEPAAASAPLHRTDCPPQSEWRWSDQGSPQVAQTPGALVPPACFPPRLPTAFASYSEMAQPGMLLSEIADLRMLWSEESATGEMTDLVTSLKALSPSGPQPLSPSRPLPLPSRPLEPRPLSPPAGSRPQPSPAGPQPQPPLGYCKRLEQLDPWPDRARAPHADDDVRFVLLRRRASFCGVVSRNGSDTLSWTGMLPSRCADPSGGYSSKVFLGGLPWDITEQTLMNALRNFQPTRVEWPGRESDAAAPRGYAYVTFESEKRVRALLATARRDGNDWYYPIGTRKMRSKEVQVIPWALNDSSWVVGKSVRLQAGRTVFVGALHGMLSASALAKIMNDLFSGVVYAGIDTDKHKYPIGSGRVTFNNVRSYVRAISAGYVEIKTTKFTKKVQLNPYIEDALCSVCYIQQGPYFCREPACFRYFCRLCWLWHHSNNDHMPLMRNSKNTTNLNNPHAVSSQNVDNALIFNGNNIAPHANGSQSPSMSGTSGSDTEPAGAGEVLPKNRTDRATALSPPKSSKWENTETSEPGGSWAQSNGQ